MGRIMDSLVQLFNDEEWQFEQHPERPVLRMGFEGKNGRWSCFAQERADEGQFVFYTVCAVNCPEELRPAMAEFITRANYGMVIGNFEMDYNDGELRYKTSVDVEHAELSRELIRPLVYINCLMMDKYLPGIMSLIYGGVDAAAAVYSVENPQPEN